MADKEVTTQQPIESLIYEIRGQKVINHYHTPLPNKVYLCSLPFSDALFIHTCAVPPRTIVIQQQPAIHKQRTHKNTRIQDRRLIKLFHEEQ